MPTLDFRDKTVKSSKIWIIIFLVSVLLFMIISASMITIETWKVWIVSTFGKYNEEELMPGLHFKIPIVQTIKKIDVKMQTVNYTSSEENRRDEWVFNKWAITILDDKNLKIGLDITVQFTPKKSEVSKILEIYWVEYFEKKLNSVIRWVVRDVAGQYKAESISVNRSKLADWIKVKLTENFVALPFDLNDVLIRNIELPEVVEKKVIAVQEAKQEEERLSMVEKQAQKNKEITIIKASAAAEQQKIEADAKAYVILKEAVATADANKKISESITKELIKYNTVNTWDGKLPTTSLHWADGVSPSIILGNR